MTECFADWWPGVMVGLLVLLVILAAAVLRELKSINAEPEAVDGGRGEPVEETTGLVAASYRRSQRERQGSK